MRNIRHGLGRGVREHLVSGNPITRLEAIILFGVSNLPDLVTEMRRQGWIIKKRAVPFAAAERRVNNYAVLKSPTNLPTREIFLTEYWLSK